jgi:shikimate kinase
LALNRHLVLVGLPGAGKSAVGRLAARLLNVDAHDIDETIERNEGCSVAEIIRNCGEHAFRVLERAETERALACPPAVVMPGGGWAAQQGNLAAVRDRVISVYLKTSPEVALARITDGRGRPLLDGPDVLFRMRALLNARQSFYESCNVTVSTDGKTVHEVATAVAELARGATAA